MDLKPKIASVSTVSVVCGVTAAVKKKSLSCYLS
jgi:hypothetical protein